MNVMSVTKSITSLLVGIAIDKGYIKSVDDKVMDYYKDVYTPKKGEKTIYDVTIKHLLTMKAPYKGKIQFGSGWWFNDQKDGMREQMKALANLGLLSTFVGMLTDSRSFISYTRHEYFRRIMCSLIGEWVEAGEYPDNPELLKKIVQGISYYNAKEYLDL